MADVTAASFRHTLRVLCAALISAQVIVLLAVSMTLDSTRFDEPPLWALGVVLAVGAVAAVLIGPVGYKLPALEPALSAEESARTVIGAVQSSTLLRFTLAEAVALVGIALAFVVDAGGGVVCLVGVAIAITLDVLHVWPSDRTLARMREALERGGAQSRLDEVMDTPPTSGTPTG
ncbi:hypothetical protein EFK50_17345 [Nocardioides marmoriginsengisoli]|uniref:Uncharacterized protein n=1 Tax=Nocardioides marmoriginsengisoli TaxID=661483 RepID=A0A3N0CCF8_9ACTN|nr:hypothetical protein [Nocardioides marmoriginsengisoli]RNL61137.1 hypothetical protein EFK50_17345 [Nocardioides marmoriginsengisoli]